MHQADDAAGTIPRHTVYARSGDLATERPMLGVGRDLVVRGDRASDSVADLSVGYRRQATPFAQGGTRFRQRNDPRRLGELDLPQSR